MTIQYLEPSVFVQDWPCQPQYGSGAEDWGRPTGFKRDRQCTVKLYVQFRYEPKDDEDREKVNALLNAHKAMMDDAVGPTNKPIRQVLVPIVTPLLKAGEPNANGDIYPEDVVRKSVMSGILHQDENVSVGCSMKATAKVHPAPWWKPWVMFGAGMLSVILLTIILVWLSWKPAVDYIVSHY